MFKQPLVSLALASSLVIVGCGGGGGDGTTEPPTRPPESIQGRVWPTFDPSNAQLPLPNDLLFDREAGDGTFSVEDTTPPVTTALNQLSGASTLAPIDIEIFGQLDPESVDAREFVLVDTDGDEIPDTPSPNPNQNVFVIKAAYASGDPVQGLAIEEPPTVPLAATAQAAGAGDQQAGASLAARAMNPAYSASVIERSGQDFIRINLSQPLEPFTRYVVVVTDGVQDIDERPIRPSPFYEILTGEDDLNEPALEPVRAIINGLWESVASGYFQVVNSARTPLGMPALSEENIALSYSFTTSNDEKVLQYLAEPAAWFDDQLTRFLRVSAAESVVTGGQDLNQDGSVGYADVKLAADGAVEAFPVNPSNPEDTSLQDALSDFFAAPPPNGCQGLSGDTAIQCVARAFTGPQAFGSLLPTPVGAEPSASLDDAQDALQVSAVLSQMVSGPGEVSVVQGEVSIPYYLGLPNGTEGSALQTASWSADAGLAEALNSSFADLGLQIPQADPAVSSVVNHVFPFPEKTENLTIPMLVIFPSDAPLDGSLPLVIYQHGITADRSAALTFGSALAESANVAVVAIDQVLHGVTPVSTEAKLETAGSLLAASDPTLNTEQNRQAVVAGQFSVGVLLQTQMAGCPLGLSDPPTQEEIAAATQAVLAGDCGPEASANLASALTLENSVANAGSTVPGLPMSGVERHFNFTANAMNQPVPMVLEEQASSAEQLGEDGSGSLFINLTNFTNTRDNNRQSAVDLMNLRASLARLDMDDNGEADFDYSQVYFVGHSLGTVVGAPFVSAVNQNQIDFGPGTAKTGDDLVAANLLTPGAGVVRMLENSPAFAPSILEGLMGAAGLTQGDEELETFFNTFQAAFDTVDPMNFADNLKAQATPLLLSTVVGDATIPNNAYPEGSGEALPDPLAGTDPFARLLMAGQTPNEAGLVPVDTVVNSRFLGATHGTPVVPLPDEDQGVTAGSAAAAFAEMVGQAAALIQTGGGQTAVTNPATMEASE